MTVNYIRECRKQLDHKIQNGNLAAVERLLLTPCGLNRLNHRGKTALHEAIHGHYLAIVEILLKNGALVDKQDRNGNTPLHLALNENQKKIVQLLLKNGASLEIRNHQNMTPLQHAASRPLLHVDLVKLLLDKGASVKVLDNRFNTPLHNLKCYIGWPAPTLNDIYDFDGGFSKRILKLRILGHRFGLTGELYEGLSFRRLISPLIRSLKNFTASHPAFRSSDEIIEALSEMRHDADSYRMMLERMRKGKLAFFIVGWRLHAVSLVVFGDYLVKGNRGESRNYISSLQVFRIQERFNLESTIKTLIKNLLKSSFKGRSIDFFERGMDKELMLQRMAIVHLSDQSTGNCGWVALKMCIDSVCYLRNEPYYKLFTEFDRKQALKMLPDFEKDRELQAVCDFADLRAKLQPKCEARGWKLPASS